MVFQVKNENKIGLFHLSSKMGSACITAKNRQGAILDTEKGDRMHFLSQKNGQGSFLNAKELTGCCTLLKILR